MNATVETDLLDYSLSRLAEHFDSAPAMRAGAVVSGSYTGDSQNGFLELAGQRVPFRIMPNSEIREIRNEAAHSGTASVVYIVPYMDAKAREICKQYHINYLDSSGNCRLIFDHFVAIIEREGVAPGLPLTQGRGFQANGLKLLHYFYEQPELLQASYRELSSATGISTGAISGILEDLRAEGFYEKRKQGTRLRRGKQLIQRWAYAYLDRVKPKLYRASLRQLNENLLEQIAQTGAHDGVAIGGERAAMIRSRYLISPNFTLHSDLRLASLFERYQLAPFRNRKEGETYLELYHVFPPFSVDETTRIQTNLPIVGDLVIYADLLDSHDIRVLEAANQLLENEIQDRFRACGLWG
jgi:hypothetical protein